LLASVLQPCHPRLSTKWSDVFLLLSFACTKESNPACRQAGKKSTANPCLPAGRQGLGNTLCLRLCCELAFGKLFIREKIEESYILFFELSLGAEYAAFRSDHTFVACAANKAPFEFLLFINIFPAGEATKAFHLRQFPVIQRPSTEWSGVHEQK
jgi:hypothetical protein